MMRTSAKVVNDALSLPPKSRAKLAEKLLESLDDPRQREIDRLWAEEVGPTKGSNPLLAFRQLWPIERGQNSVHSRGSTLTPTSRRTSSRRHARRSGSSPASAHQSTLPPSVQGEVFSITLAPAGGRETGLAKYARRFSVAHEPIFAL